MKKILIFGCSYSAGSWEPYASKEEREREKFTATGKSNIDKLIENSKGWYHYVDYFKDKDVTVIAISGDGYFAWYQLLLMLDGANKLNYDEIWIQETNEPRVGLLNTKKLELEWNHPRNMKEIDNIKVFNEWGYGILLTLRASAHPTLLTCNTTSNLKIRNILEKNDFEKNIFFNGQFFYNIILKITELFQELCTKRGISGYVWSMNDPIMNCTRFTRLPLIGIFGNAFSISYIHLKLEEAEKNKNFLTTKQTGHQTEEGNKFIGELINKACIDLKI
tara:strand:+ start:335 stop:1165 length:831 start_codon:yes stop_codon:yes gene_type:complete